jgi:glycosyltransferase involved in cell wall biosynthesis
VNILSIGGLVPWHPEAGGGQIIAYKTSEALAHSGHKLHYLSIAPEGYERRVDWGEVEYAPRGLGLLEALRLAPQLARSVPRNDYDVVHVHLGGETIGYCLAYALARRMGLKPRLAMSIYAPKAHALPRSVGEVITAFCCHSADLIFCLSEFSKRDISRAYHVPTSKLGVTYAGVDSAFTVNTSRRNRSHDDPFSLLFSGRLNGPHEQKGLDVLLKSLPQVLSHHKVVLNIIGTGPRLPQYQALAGELGIREHVRFLGFVEHQQMPRQYQQVDLFVLPSRRESFGLVLAEAMACGLPVVATTAGAIPEVVEDGVTGVLVPPDDPEALANAVVSLLSDPQRMKAMGKAGAERVRERFTWDKVAERVIQGCERALQVVWPPGVTERPR